MKLRSQLDNQESVTLQFGQLKGPKESATDVIQGHTEDQ